jgi:hypothetical protein
VSAINKGNLRANNESPMFDPAHVNKILGPVKINNMRAGYGKTSMDRYAYSS